MRPYPLLLAALLSCALPAMAGDLSPGQAAVLAFAPTTEQAPREPIHVRAARSWQAAAGSMPYEASVDEYPATEAGQTVGLVTTFGYTKLPADRTRPVVFLFNGGPGASSWSLHLEGFGPVRYDPGHDDFASNPDTLLDVADLVFIDPLGTGASAPFHGTTPRAAWTAEGDARLILQAMDAWLANHGREDAKVFVVGESYGTARATAMLHFASAEDASRIHGVVLLSLALGGLPDPAMQASGRLPSMAATAWYHHKGSTGLPSGADAYARAVDTSAASPTQISDWTGTAPTAGEKNTGVPESPAFRHDLLKDQGLVVGSLDTRATADKTLGSLPPPYNDPGMTLGKRPSTLMARYLLTLGYRSNVAYRMLNLSINRSWDYGGGPDQWPFAGYLASAMQASPSLRLFTAGGIYDLSTPVYAGILTLRQAGVPSDRWSSHVYPSGHTIGEDPAQRPVLARDLRAFITRR
ncbi:hypothetical protein KPL74_05970 [Bacillus sp. NP157]|nr:hypothetical protein KPL74_05970 [Bacillus sp. NP157]